MLLFVSDMTVCSATASEGDYTVTFKTHNNSVFFTVSARTVQWVAIGVSEDTLMVHQVYVLSGTLCVQDMTPSTRM